MAGPESGKHGSRRRRRVVARPAGRREWLGAGLLVVTIAGGALAFGGLHTQVLLPIGLASLVSAALLRPEQAPPLVWVLIGLATYTLFQLVPLPFSWVEALSPSGAEIWRVAFKPFGSPPPSFVSLSVDPGSTAIECVKWFSYAGVLLAASGWRSWFGATSLALLVFASALAVSVVTLAHGIVAAPRIYGLFTPNGTLLWSRGPLINPNNLAGYLNLGLFAGLGVWLARRDAAWARLLPIGIGTLALHVLLTRSRGGIGALALGVMIFGYLALSGRHRDWRRLGIAGAAGVLSVLVLALVLAGPEIRTEILDPSLGDKATVWIWSLDLMRDFPVFGVGRGAFEGSFQPYRKAFGYDWTKLFAFAENFAVQWVCDWGIPVGIAALAACFAFVPGLVRRALRDPLSAGLVTGLGILFLQNLVDLALEVFSVTATALVAFAAVHSGSSTRRLSKIQLGFAAAGVAMSAVVVLATGVAPVQLERDRLAGAYRAFVASRPRDATAIMAQIRSSMERHPGDAYFPLIGALVVRQTQRGDPFRWIGRAIERAPINGSAHIVLAQMLAERGHVRQALIHVRLAALYDGTLREYALQHAGVWAKNIGDLLAVFPRGMEGSELIHDLCDKARVELRVDCWREAINRRSSLDARYRLADSLLDVLETEREPCTASRKAGCVREVEELLSQGPTSDAADYRAASYRARLLAFRGDFKGAVSVALERCPAAPEAADCLRRALDFARRAGDLSLMGAIATRYVALHCAEQPHCAAAHDVIGAKYAEMGAWGFALSHFSAATSADATAERWLRNAEAAAHIGSDSTARMSLERASRSPDFSSGQRERMASIEELLRDKTLR
jgi:hypothetical protein